MCYDGRKLQMIATLMMALALLSSQAMAGQGFLAALQDVPLMAGLREVPGRGLTYDKPAGRIVEAYAKGAVAAAAARGYYANTLPQLGWRPLAPDSFERDGETLKMHYQSDTAGITIRFVLAPSR